MNVLVRVVASLIATVFILFLGSDQVQAAYVWGPQDLTMLREYQIAQINISGQSAPNHKVAVADTSTFVFEGVTMTEAALLDEINRRCVASGATNCGQTQWVPSGRAWNVFKLGTPGTVPVTRFYIIPINSHVFVAANEMVGTESALTVLRRYPTVYQDEGEKFAIIAPFDGFAEGKLPLPQACGDEKQSGLTAMLRVYNSGAQKSDKPSSVPMAVRFNDGNHQFTTRNDATFMVNLRQVPGWEIAERDMDTTARRAGVWCVPSKTEKLIQTTADAVTVPGDGTNGVWIQAQVHDLSRFILNGTQISLQTGYEPTIYRTATTADQTGSGRFDVDSNRGVFALTRANGGYVEYGNVVVQATAQNVLPDAVLSVDYNWSAIKIDEETGIVYAMSVTDTIKIHAYNPGTNTYFWQYTVPEAYRQYYAGDSELHLAGNYFVTYLQWFTNARDNFKGALVVIPLLGSGAMPEVRIIDLPGPNNNPTDFAFNAETNIGTFADARGGSLIHLNFNDWSMTTELVPFEPYAVLVSNVSGEMYATQVPRGSSMTFIPVNGAVWKRSLSGNTWSQVASVGRSAIDLSAVNLSGVPKVMVFNRAGGSGTTPTFQGVDFIDLKTGVKAPVFEEQLFGSMNLQKGLAGSSQRQ